MAAKKGNKYAVGNKGGRPRSLELEELDQFGIDLIEWAKNKARKKTKKPIPFWLGEFARERGLYGYNIRDYAKGERIENKVFSQRLEEAKEIQLGFFAENGLLGKWNAIFTKFVLPNISEWRDKQTVSGDKENPIQHEHVITGMRIIHEKGTTGD